MPDATTRGTGRLKLRPRESEAPDPERLVARAQKLLAGRANVDALQQEIADYVIPAQGRHQRACGVADGPGRGRRADRARVGLDGDSRQRAPGRAHPGRLDEPVDPVVFAQDAERAGEPPLPRAHVARRRRGAPVSGPPAIELQRRDRRGLPRPRGLRDRRHADRIPSGRGHVGLHVSWHGARHLLRRRERARRGRHRLSLPRDDGAPGRAAVHARCRARELALGAGHDAGYRAAGAARDPAPARR